VILLVDDNEDFKTIYEAAFRHHGIDLKVCLSGGEALKYLESCEACDAVILDLSMPIQDGLTIAEEIRFNESLHPEKKPVRLAFFTARNIDGAIRRIAERTNVERVFQKPIDPYVLISRIKEWLGYV
jgi:CheY-like chemotaxis protein